MNKGLVTILFFLFTLLALTIIFMSTGWFLIAFIIVLPPAMFLHIFTWYKSIKGHPALYGWIILSSFIFFIFSLLRIDKDELGVYNGYQAVLYKLGISESVHAGPILFSLEISFVLLFCTILLDALILRIAYTKSKR